VASKCRPSAAAVPLRHEKAGSTTRRLKRKSHPHSLMTEAPNVESTTKRLELSDALCELLCDGSFNHAAAVGIYFCHLEESITHPHDCAWPDGRLSQLEEALGANLQAVESEARALFAAKCLCRVLQRERALAGPDDVTTIECSSEMEELEALIDAFGWGFPGLAAIAAEVG